MTETQANTREHTFKLTERQTRAFDVLNGQGDTAVEVLFGGAKYGAKTYGGCILSFLEANRIIDTYGLKPSRYPLLIGFLGRKVAKDFHEQVMEVWNRAIPADCYTIKGNPPEIIIRDTVKFITGGFDRGETIRFKGQALWWAFVDQAEEVTLDDISELRAHVFYRAKIGDQSVPGRMLLTANPSPCWLEQDYDVSGRESEQLAQGNLPIKRIFIQALPKDNSHLDPRYLDTLRASFSHRPELLAGYLEGSWTHLDGAMTIFKQEWLTRARSLVRSFDETRHLIACDPARMGSCETVIYYFKNDRIEDERIYGQQTTDVTCGEIQEMANRHKINGVTPQVAIDADGIGGPIADHLSARGLRVIEVHGNAPTTHPERFYNKRAEMWWTVAERYSRGQICEGVGRDMKQHSDPELDKQLRGVQYKWSRGKILVESKDEMLADGRKSPDRADAKVIGLYVLPTIEPIASAQHWQCSRTEDDNDDVAMSYAVESVI